MSGVLHDGSAVALLFDGELYAGLQRPTDTVLCRCSLIDYFDIQLPLFGTPRFRRSPGALAVPFSRYSVILAKHSTLLTFSERPS